MKKLTQEHVSLLLFVASAALISSLSVLSGGNYQERLPLDILLVLVPSAYRFPHRSIRLLTAVFPLSAVLFYLSVLSGNVSQEVLAIHWPVWLCLLVVLQLLSGCAAGGMAFFRDMDRVMKSGNVWSVVNLRADLLYLCATAIPVLLLSGLFSTGALPALRAFLLLLLSVLEVMILIRQQKHLVLVLFRAKERNIVETMNENKSHMTGKQYDSIYKEIYDRLVEYFVNEKPYLNEALTSNDVAREIYTNKVYLSRAINMATSKNYCQFVNTYRIRHAVELFRENPDLRVQDLSVMSGFHNVVTFNMAFRMNMELPPSEWCRMEKSRLSKKKK